MYDRLVLFEIYRFEMHLQYLTYYSDLNHDKARLGIPIEI